MSAEFECELLKIDADDLYKMFRFLFIRLEKCGYNVDHHPFKNASREEFTKFIAYLKQKKRESFVEYFNSRKSRKKKPSDSRAYRAA